MVEKENNRRQQGPTLRRQRRPTFRRQRKPTLQPLTSKQKSRVVRRLITYKDVEILAHYLSRHGKILPRRRTGLGAKQQKKVTRLIKVARNASILPYVIGSGDLCAIIAQNRPKVNI
jgi:small subunit ribosomal protein S18